MQSDQGFHCLQTKSLETIECFNGEQMSLWCFAYVQVDVNLHILLVLKGTFSFGTAHLRLQGKFVLESKHWEHWWVDCLWV